MANEGRETFSGYRSSGVIHVHSLFSDGTGDVKKISHAAKKAGLDWVIITDHNSMDIQEGFYDGVCVIRGEEISPQGENHYLALGIKECIEPKSPHEFIEDVRRQGGFGFAAHPDEGVGVNDNSTLEVPRQPIRGGNEEIHPSPYPLPQGARENCMLEAPRQPEPSCRKNKHKPIRWLDKNIIPDGIEIWNWFSEWADNLNDRTIFHLAYAYFFRHKLVKKPNQVTLSWWDELNNLTEKIVPAIGGVDAHALRVTNYIVPVTIFPYEEMFKTITNVITTDEPLSEDFERRKSQILAALRSGNNIIVNRKVDKCIPKIGIKKKPNSCRCKNIINLDSEPILEVETNKKCKIRVLHNGKEIKCVLSKSLELTLDKIGKYRVEILQGNRGFTYSNPICVKE